MIKAKDKTYSKFIKENNTIAREEILSRYKQQKNEITKLTRKSKKLHYNEYFTINNRNMKKLWAGINQILNKNSNSSNSPVCIEIDNDGNVSTIIDPKGISNAFNSHYTSVADKILKNVNMAETSPIGPIWKILILSH